MFDEKKTYDEIIWASYKPIAKCNILYLGREDINHLVRPYHKYSVSPESVAKAQIRFLCDREIMIRYLIKELDLMLAPGGDFDIISTNAMHRAHGVFIRSADQIMYEFSVATNGRYVLLEKSIEDHILKFRYRKKRNVLLTGDSINRWSFGIITNGTSANDVRNLVDSILEQQIPFHEIIICGPSPYQYEFIPNNVKIIKDISLEEDIRAPITKKKNAIIKEAKYNNLCILHDRFLLPKSWYYQMKLYGNYYDLLIVRNLDSRGYRIGDWLEHAGKPGELFGRSRVTLDYSEWTNNWYAPGGVIIIKKNLVMPFLLDERLQWAELEDIQFSQIANLNGLFCYIDVNNYLITQTNSPRLEKIKEIPLFLKWIKQHISKYKRLTTQAFYYYLNLLWDMKTLRNSSKK